MVAVRKWSVSVDEELARRAEARLEGRPLSGFVARAVDHELERAASALISTISMPSSARSIPS